MSTDLQSGTEVPETETSAGGEFAATIAESQSQAPVAPVVETPAVETEPVVETPQPPQPVAAEPTTETTEGTEGTEPAVQPAGEPAETAKPAEGEPEVTVRSIYDRMHPGSNVTAKYKDDAAFMRGMGEAQRMLGQRNTEAEQFRALQSRFPSQEAFNAFVRGEQQPAAAEQPQPSAPAADPAPATFDQSQVWTAQINAARAAGKEPSAELVQKLADYGEWVNRNASSLLGAPLEYLKPFIDPYLAEREQRQQQAFQQAQQQQAEAARRGQQFVQFFTQNKDWMFVGGDLVRRELTPNGQRLEAWYTYFLSPGQENGNEPRALDRAYDKLRVEAAQQQAQQQPQPAVQPVKPQALHKPAVAAAPAPDVQEQYNKDLESLDFGDHMKKIWGQQQAAAGQVG